MGIAGKSEKEAALTSMHEYRLLVEGHERKQRTQWEIARWQTWHEVLLSPNGCSGNKPKTPQALCRFPWEGEQPQETQPQNTRVTQEEADILNEMFGRNKSTDNG